MTLTSASFIDDDIALWEKFVTPALGKRAARQFINATRRSSNLFAERFIHPQIFQPDRAGGGAYVPVDITAHTPGRNHILAQSLADGAAYAGLGVDPAIGLTYFANVLRIGCKHTDPLTGDLEWERPSDRVVLGDLYAFTFEFDVNDPAFLERQLSWLRSTKNPLDCAVGGLYRHLSQFADFAGITVNYSGNKSLHFHLVFETVLAAAQLGLGKATDVRRGLIAHWDDLHGAVLDHLPVPSGVTADASLRLPEAYRRIPNGARAIESDRHLLGIPAGTIVSQVTLWEKWVERAASGAEVLFFRPEPFFAVPTSRSLSTRANMSGSRRAPTFRKVLSPEEMAYCESKLAAFYPGYPKFEGLAFESGRWVARFSNSPMDRTPSSIMTGEHERIMLVGRHAAGLKPRKLPFALATMIRGWVAEFHRPKAAEWEDCDWSVDPSRSSPPNAHEAAFAEAATDQTAASRQIRRFLRKAVLAEDCTLICAPEGIRKTSSLFADHHRLQGALEAQRGSALSMYAFADYEAAAQKCAAFNAVQDERRSPAYVGIVLPSFSKAYEDACREVGVSPITSETAAGAGYPNLWNAVEVIQPTVLDSLKARHRRIWDEIGPRKPVFFTVHDVAQRWTLTTPTRLMWARGFWIGRMDDPGHVRDCRRSTALGLLVHDEVSFESLVALHRAEAIEWVAGLKASEPKVWQGRRSNLARQFASYRRFVNAIPFPVVGGTSCSVSFNEAREIVGLGDVAWDEVETCWSGEYGPLDDDQTDDIYATRMGRRWRVAPRGWWRGAAERVVVLTTEAVPTEIARRLGDGWAVHELETPLLKRDWVDVYPQRGVTGGKLINVVSDYRRSRDEAACTVISNKVKALPGTITHMSARGSNAFIGKDLAQTMTFLTPDEVERLEALNAWTGRSDLIRARHWDQFNQSCGRNLGFRKQGDVRHDLLIGHRLLECLLSAGLDRSRYDLRLHLSRGQRYAVRIKAA